MEKRSLGLIETWGYVPAVEAADAGAKAANVVFLGYEKVQAGLITIRFLGEVAAVKAAVAAGAAAAEKVGRVVAVHVIPRPDGQIPIGTPGEPPPTTKPKAEPPKPPPPSKEKTVEKPAKPPSPPEGEKVEVMPEPPPPDKKKAELAPEPATPPKKKKRTPKKAKAKKRRTQKT
jgi:microcompartment protein CcmL/EutN